MSQLWGQSSQTPTVTPYGYNPYAAYHPTYGRVDRLRKTYDEGIQRRDELITQMRRENDELNKCYKELDEEHAKCEERYEELMQQYKALEEEIISLREQLRVGMKLEKKAVEYDQRKINKAQGIREEPRKRPTPKPVKKKAVLPTELLPGYTPTPDWNSQALARMKTPTFQDDTTDEESTPVEIPLKEDK